MADFKYLEAEIDPPAWLMWLTVLAIVGAYVGFWIYVLRHPNARDYSLRGFRSNNSQLMDELRLRMRR